MGTQVTVKNALLYLNSTRISLSYRDICKNELHIVTHEESNKESLIITKSNRDHYDILKRIPSLPSALERIPSLPSGLYYIYIKLIPHATYKVIF
jgi:hypothetical protein